MTDTPASYRNKYATVHTKGGDEKFPIHDAKHAKSALKLINRAKPPLSSAQKAAVRKRAAKYLGKTPDPKAKSKKTDGMA